MSEPTPEMQWSSARKAYRQSNRAVTVEAQLVTAINSLAARVAALEQKVEALLQKK
jgi:hypothetical protein